MITGQIIPNLDENCIYVDWKSILPVIMHAHVVPPLVAITFPLLTAKRLCPAFKTQLTVQIKKVVEVLQAGVGREWHQVSDWWLRSDQQIKPGFSNLGA